jgi:hypothetical protein
MRALIGFLRTALSRALRGQRGRRALLEQGQPFPRVRLLDDRGQTVDSADWLGRRTVLWFYPKADTPG